MDQTRIIPIDGVNPYSNHPGFDEKNCHLQYTVTQLNPYGSIKSAGFGCEVTGGHCLPRDKCKELRLKYPESLQPQWNKYD